MLLIEAVIKSGRQGGHSTDYTDTAAALEYAIRASLGLGPQIQKHWIEIPGVDGLHHSHERCALTVPHMSPVDPYRRLNSITVTLAGGNRCRKSAPASIRLSRGRTASGRHSSFT